MKITQIVADGRPGGGTVMVLALVEALVEAGHQVSLVTDADSSAARQGRELGVQVEEISFFSFFSATKALAAAIERLRPDTLHVHGNRAAHHLVAAGLDAWPRVHYTVHGYHFEHKNWPSRLAGRWLERRVGRRLESVVHVCDYDRRLAENRSLVAPDTPRQVIYNGVDVDELPERVPEPPVRVAFVGRLVPQKDPKLITATAKLLAADGIAVVIVGGGPAEPEVRRRLRQEIAAGRVEMTGEVERERALATMAASGALMLPSRWEGLPVVLLEAMALGVPVVAAEVGGVPEALAGGKAGILVPGRDAEAFAAAGRRLLYDGDLKANLIAAASALVRERFQLRDCLARYLQLYG